MVVDQRKKKTNTDTGLHHNHQRHQNWLHRQRMGESDLKLLLDATVSHVLQNLAHYRRHCHSLLLVRGGQVAHAGNSLVFMWDECEAMCHVGWLILESAAQAQPGLEFDVKTSIRLANSKPGHNIHTSVGSWLASSLKTVGHHYGDHNDGIKVSPFVSLKPSLWGSPTLILPTPPLPLTSPLTVSQSTLDTSVAINVTTLEFTPPTTTLSWAYQLRALLSSTDTSAAIDVSNPSSIITTTTMVFAPDPSVLPRCLEVTLEFDKSPSNLKKFTRRRIKIGEQVTMLQTEENHISLTRKRNRGAKGEGVDDTKLVIDPVFIVKLANKISQEAMEKMQMDLSQAYDKIMVSPSMGTKIQGALKDLFRSFVQVEEAKAKEAEFEMTLDDFSNQFSKKLASVA
eukprot:Gb_08042 [translate_table: standard]